MKAEQVSVPLPDELRAYVRRRAAVEDRSVASVIRRLATGILWRALPDVLVPGVWSFRARSLRSVLF
jgi:hypothetical protein